MLNILVILLNNFFNLDKYQNFFVFFIFFSLEFFFLIFILKKFQRKLRNKDTYQPLFFYAFLLEVTFFFYIIIIINNLNINDKLILLFELISLIVIFKEFQGILQRKFICLILIFGIIFVAFFIGWYFLNFDFFKYQEFILNYFMDHIRNNKFFIFFIFLCSFFIFYFYIKKKNNIDNFIPADYAFRYHPYSVEFQKAYEKDQKLKSQSFIYAF